MRKNGIIRIGINIKENDILIGKIKTKNKQTSIIRLLDSLFQQKTICDTSIKTPKGVSGTITKLKLNNTNKLFSITIFITENRQIAIGDKLAGRHGNKGIISTIVPEADMPFLPDGTAIDILLNPLGIPSRMNVGQIFECMLSLAAINLSEKYKLLPFDEKQSKIETSKVIVYNKLYEARNKSNKKWLFNLSSPGKTKIFDGRTGAPCNQPILIGYAYILKLMHLVKDKLNARLIGPYSAISKQPIRGKSRKGGQRFGEMEIWALEGFGAAYLLHEIITIKSDDLTTRSKALISLTVGTSIPEPSCPETLKILILELQALALEINIFSKVKKSLY